MFSISKAFRVLSLVIAAVLVPATAFAGSTGYAAAKPGQAAAHPKKALKLKKARTAKPGNKGNKANKNKANKAGHGSPKIKILKKH